jgi:hypothetical protein
MSLRRETAENPFRALEMRMGATHFLIKRLPNVAAALSHSPVLLVNDEELAQPACPKINALELSAPSKIVRNSTILGECDNAMRVAW